MSSFPVILLLTLIPSIFALFFGGGSGGCNCGGGCPAPPVCNTGPQVCPPVSCPTGGGGFYAGGISAGQPIAAQPLPVSTASGGGYYATAPVSGGPVAGPVGAPYSASYIPGTAVPGGTYVVGAGNSGVSGYASPTATQAKTTTKTRYSSSNEKDLYDEPPPDFKVADVSAESKELEASDFYKRRYLALKNLRHRHLRQLSAPSFPVPASNVCNNEKLARIMAKSIVTDISISKRLVRKATEIAFKGLKFDVICAQGDFSYSIYAEQYCETTRGNVTCFAFT